MANCRHKMLNGKLCSKERGHHGPHKTVRNTSDYSFRKRRSASGPSNWW